MKKQKLSPDTTKQLEKWLKLFRKRFKINRSFSHLVIPEREPGVGRLIIEPHELTNMEVFKAIRRFPASYMVFDRRRSFLPNKLLNITLDTITDSSLFTKGDRAYWIRDQVEPDNDLINYSTNQLVKKHITCITLDTITDISLFTKGDRAYWIRDQVEPDNDLINYSTNQLVKKHITCITLRGMMLYELIYHEETGHPLKAEIDTLCAGSRTIHDGVPCVGWGTIYRDKPKCELFISHSKLKTHGTELSSRRVIM